MVCAFLAGCSGKIDTPSFFPDRGNAAVSSPKPAARPPRRKHEGYAVLLVSGSAYASSADLCAHLAGEYGDEKNGGMLAAVDSLKSTESLPDGSVIITLGAREGTVRDLSRLRDLVSGLRIVSIFPLDEPLQVESVSDLVIDRLAPAGILADERSAAAESLSVPDLSFLLLVAALSVDIPELPPLPEKRLAEALARARSNARLRNAGSAWTFTSWVDPETGLRSGNHCVLDTGAAGETPSGTVDR